VNETLTRGKNLLFHGTTRTVSKRIDAKYVTILPDKEIVMWNSLFHVGLTTATVDFTNELSWLLTGLVGLVLLSVAAIALTALDGHKDERLLRTAVQEEVAYREAA
jgi:hypothetical protein